MSNALGGAETVIFSIIDNLNGQYDFKYLCPEGNIEDILKEKNIEYKTFKSIREIKKIIEEINPDVIHAHDFTASLISGLFNRNRKIISHLHTSHRWIKSLNIKSILYYLISFRFKNIVFVSKSMAKEMYFYNRLNKKSSIIINPIDKENIFNLSNEYYVEDNYDLGFLGRLSDYKDPLKFIEIVNELKQKNVNIRAVIVGDGELREKCKTRVKEIGLSENIDFKGFLKNPFPVVKNINILVMPSKVEALGLSAIEAMALSKPVIASNIGGLSDFINEKNGCLCNCLEEFIENIQNILSNREKYNEMASNALKTALTLSDVNKYIFKIDGLYK